MVGGAHLNCLVSSVSTFRPRQDDQHGIHPVSKDKKKCAVPRNTAARGHILGRNPDKSLKSFPPFYFTSTTVPSGFYFFKLTQPLMYFFKLMQSLIYFYSKLTVHCQGERRKPDRKPDHLPYGSSLSRLRGRRKMFITMANATS